MELTAFLPMQARLERTPAVGTASSTMAPRKEHPDARKLCRVATVLITDIVDSTRTAARLGDERWADLLERHNQQARAGVEEHAGHLVDTAGDRVFAVFASPESAIACATGIHRRMRELQLGVRAGVHLGEVAVREDQFMGLAVHIAARIAALARSGETLVSRPVKDWLGDRAIDFCERGVHTLKGVPDQWELFAILR